MHVFDRNRFISATHSSNFTDCRIHVDMHRVIKYYICLDVFTYTYVLNTEFNDLKLQKNQFKVRNRNVKHLSSLI